jgi:hypothetical protein
MRRKVRKEGRKEIAMMIGQANKRDGEIIREKGGNEIKM